MSKPQHVSASLTALQENLATQLFGIPLSRAKEIGVCINCKKLAGPRCYSAAGRRSIQSLDCVKSVLMK